MEQAGARLYREAVARGIDPAEELVVCLGDGAPANWSQFGLHFPNRVEVLDWYHAVEHLWAAARDRWGEDSARVEAWMEARKEELWDSLPWPRRALHSQGLRWVLSCVALGQGIKSLGWKWDKTRRSDPARISRDPAGPGLRHPGGRRL